MTYLDKVTILYNGHLAGMNGWGKGFIYDMIQNLQDDSELTDRQKEKIDELFIEHVPKEKT